MRWTLFLLLLLPSLAAQDKDKEPPLRLELALSKPAYDEFEPVIARLWLVNQGKQPAALIKGYFHIRKDPSSLKGGTPARGGIWLTDEKGNRLDAGHFLPRRHIRLVDQGYQEKNRGMVGIGGGSAGTSRLYSYHHLPPEGRLLLHETQDLYGSHKFTDPAGGTFRSRSRLKVGTYQVRASYKAGLPRAGIGERKADQANRILCRAVDLQVSRTFRVLLSNPKMRRRWQQVKGIELGMSRQELEKRLGPPWSEYFLSHIFTQRGRVSLQVVKYHLGKLVSPSSTLPWGMMNPPTVTARFTADGQKLVYLQGSHFCQRRH